MFLTNDHNRLNNFLTNTNEHCWSAVEVMLRKCWFFVESEFKEADISISGMCLIGNAIDISKLDTNQHSIKNIYIVSPPYINGTGDWEFNKLQKVITGTINFDNFEFQIEIYELTDGVKYYSKSGLNNNISINNEKVIYDGS